MEQQDEINKMLQEGRISEAIQRLNTLLSAASQPDDRLYYLLGNAYRKEGDFQRALNCYLEAMSINPDSPAAEAHQMLMNIIEFYHKDYYNP